MRRSSARSARSGYTLVELLVVLAVLGVLAAMAMPLAEVTAQRDKERELKRALWEIRDAIDDYRRVREAIGAAGVSGVAGVSVFPPDLVTLTLPLTDPRPERRGEMHRFLRRVPRDPFADAALPAERTWGLRSYLSDADRPQPGVDVYDVYSQVDRVGLNGVPLRQW